ncbi:3-oxoacyl-ACP reductase family protein [Edaphobacter modestus]|uniref:3-oxoacyl-[acyl-carrier protein] reductase n=1 Tax=Edaphobacter modestus TaxID=388466 RepID=A0A4V2G4V3_9BACT|nr:3-oxoacyl-ACP reductase family protein [Edaphobacter modestus]RZU42426.1 3-oxoacyl-[acyl-carrier protein] reductase [Edaphobacter modestus]
MESSLKSLTGKTALITGGSRGIGRAAALSLAAQGCDVAVNYLNSEEDATSIVRAIEELGRRAYAFRADVSRQQEVESMVKKVQAELGTIDILVNNAGINPSRPFLELDASDWSRTIETNLTSAFLLSQAVIPAMRQQQWGRLVFISSVAAQTGGVVGPHYAASKAGMLGLMHSYANLLAKEGITSNAIAPALIETEMIRKNKNIRPDLIPVGRFGHAEEVADAIAFIASNGYITGQTLNLNGGWYMS